MPASLLTVTPLTASGISHVGFTPIRLSGLILWLDANQISGVTSGTSLSVWTDSSASASNATQPTGAAQPVFVATAQNSLSIVSFNGAQFMVSLTSLPQVCTVAIAAQSHSTGAGQPMFVGGASSAKDGLFSDATAYAAYAGTFFDTSTFTTDAWISMIAQFNGSNTTVTVSGATFVGNTSSATETTLAVGGTSGGNKLTGKVGEVLVYNRILTEAERLGTDQYFRSKWSTI